MRHSEKLHVLHADTTARRQQEHPIMLKLVSTASKNWSGVDSGNTQDPRLCSVGGENACGTDKSEGGVVWWSGVRVETCIQVGGAK